MPIPGLGFTDDQLFQACNIVLPCWILLALAPGSKATQAIVLLSSLVLCALYAALVYPLIMSDGLNFQDFTSLKGVTKLFSSAPAVLPCWAHFSVGDLWVGRWIAFDGAQKRISRFVMAPILFLAMMLNPVGLGLYLLLRGLFAGRR